MDLESEWCVSLLVCAFCNGLVICPECIPRLRPVWAGDGLH